MYLFSPAKINLGLWVGPVLENGYHPIESLCIPISFGDWLRICPQGRPFKDKNTLTPRDHLRTINCVYHAKGHLAFRDVQRNIQENLAKKALDLSHASSALLLSLLRTLLTLRLSRLKRRSI